MRVGGIILIIPISFTFIQPCWIFFLLMITNLRIAVCRKAGSAMFLFAAIFCCLSSAVSAQSAGLVGELAGTWRLTASPFAGGNTEIVFAAVPSADGTSLDCHADNFLSSSTMHYAADWQIAVEQDNGKMRLGWKLNADTPASSMEYQESATSYVIGGVDADGSHRYIFLLSENIETQRLEGLTLWTDWQSDVSAVFTLPKTQQIYAVISRNVPCSGGAVGYAEIWSSGRLTRVADDASVEEVTSAAALASTPVYSLQGVRRAQLCRGINIVGGHKIIRQK